MKKLRAGEIVYIIWGMRILKIVLEFPSETTPGDWHGVADDGGMTRLSPGMWFETEEEACEVLREKEFEEYFDE